MESRSWAEEFVYSLVGYEGRFFAWIAGPWDGGDQVYERDTEEAARELLGAEQARMLLATSWGERVAAVQASDESSGRILFSAAVLDGAEDGIWLATSEADGNDDCYNLTGFDHLSVAVDAFEASTRQVADKLELLDIGWPKIAAGHLRYQAALVRAGASRAVLGDTLRACRGRIRAERAVSRVASTAGISREFLYRVLTGDEWTWKNLVPPRKNVLPRVQVPTRPVGLVAEWVVWARFAIDAPAENDVFAIADDVLRQIGIPLACEPKVDGGNGVWTVTVDFDISRLEVIEPNEARTFLSYVSGRMPDSVTWVSHVKEREGTFEWPPSFWEKRAGAAGQLLHPAIRAAMIHVRPSEKDSKLSARVSSGP